MSEVVMTWPKAVDSITAVGTKTYYVGDEIDLNDLKVNLVLADNTTSPLFPYDYSINPRKFTEADQTVTVSYKWGDKEVSAAVTGLTVNALTVSSIALKYDVVKKVYKVDEAFDPTGLAISALYNNGNYLTVAEGLTLSEPDMSTAGEKTITITYGGKSTSTTITVETVKTLAIVVTTPPNKLVYTWGENLDVDGLVVQAIDDTGAMTDVTESCSYTFNDNTTVASEDTTSVKITYGTLTKNVYVLSEPEGVIAIPSISLDEDNLTISTEDENTTSYDLYVDGTFNQNIPQPDPNAK